MKESTTTATDQPSEISEFEYQVLKPDSGHTSLETTEALQEKYLWMLSDLIDRAVGGEPETRCNTIVFLDKSARPLAWMMRKFWDELAPQERNPENGELQTVAMPEFRFASIDRLDWRVDRSKEFSEGGMRDPKDSDINGLRAVFQTRDKNVLDGRNVLIVDEQSESGDTLTVAQKLFEEAFPSSNIKGASWVTHPYKIDEKTGDKVYVIEEIPVWYPLRNSDKTQVDDTGRGVYSVVPYERRSEAFRRRFPEESNQFVSSRPKNQRDLTKVDRQQLERLEFEYSQANSEAEKRMLRFKIDSIRYSRKDEKSEQLKREIGAMLIDFTTGKLKPAVVTNRETINGLPAREYHAQAILKRTRQPRGSK